jgi:hypothetical protein
MDATPYQTTNTLLRASDFTPVSITAGTVYAQADLQNIKIKLAEYDALLKAAGENANQIS